MRQIPSKRAPWSAYMLVSQDGELRRRQYHALLQTWSWGATPTIHIDEQGMLYTQFENKRLHLTKAVARAWLPRLSPTDRLHVEEDSSGMRSMAWRCGGATGTDESSDEIATLEGDAAEMWRPLPSLGATCIPLGEYYISSHGRVRSACGEIACGVYVGKEKVLCLADGHLVRVDDARDVAFLDRTLPPHITPRVQQLVDYMAGGDEWDTYALDANIATATAWSYLYEACKAVPLERARDLALMAVATDSFRVIQALCESAVGRHYLCSGDADAIDELMAHETGWLSIPHRHSELRILKIIREREQLTPQAT